MTNIPISLLNIESREEDDKDDLIITSLSEFL